MVHDQDRLRPPFLPAVLAHLLPHGLAELARDGRLGQSGPVLPTAHARHPCRLGHPIPRGCDFRVRGIARWLYAITDLQMPPRARKWDAMGIARSGITARTWCIR